MYQWPWRKLTDHPLAAMLFLSLILDSVKQELCLPPDKLAELMYELDRWSTRRQATKCELLSLIGKLSFAARAISVGHLLLCRLITLASNVAHLHHRIHLNAEARADITWWQAFLPTWNSTTKFIDLNSVLAADMFLHANNFLCPVHHTSYSQHRPTSGF